MKSENNLDQLLEYSSEIDAPSADVLLAARNIVTTEAEVTAARAARIVHMRRRHRRLTIGVAAAAVAGLVAVPLLSQGSSTSAPPAAGTRATRHAPVVQEHFRTVAQVISAAAAAAGRSPNPADAPYWKIVKRWDCSGVADAKGTLRPSGSTCENTQWNGNGRPGVSGDANGGYMQIDAATVTVDGRTIGWKQANTHSWTDAQVATMVADTGSSGNGRAPAGDYVFKNAIGLLVYMPASPTIRKQLWHELGSVQGAILNGRVKDSLGRTGWKITLDTPGWGSQWLVVNTDTGAVLEDGGNGATSGTQGWIETIVFAGPSDTAPAALTQEQARQQRIAQARACGLTPRMEHDMARVARLTGRMPQPSARIQACLAGRG